MVRRAGPERRRRRRGRRDGCGSRSSATPPWARDLRRWALRGGRRPRRGRATAAKQAQNRPPLRQRTPTQGRRALRRRPRNRRPGRRAPMRGRRAARWRGRRAARWRPGGRSAGANTGAPLTAARVRPAELRVANTGAPLTAAGVAALASLRASAKRDEAGAVGRFGVGFAAVLAVSDAPRVVSTSGAVAFSADADGGGGRRTSPARPPSWPAATRRPSCGWSGRPRNTRRHGFATEVRLPLRDGRRRRRAARPRPFRRVRPVARPARPRRDRRRRARRAACGAGRRGHDRAAAVAAGATRGCARGGRRRRRAARPPGVVGDLGVAALRRARRRRRARPDRHRRSPQPCPPG